MNTTVSVSAELLRELGYIADNESYMVKTIAFIKSLTHRQQAEEKGVAYMTLLEQLSDFQEYQNGWDGSEALPLNAKVVRNFKSVLQKCNERGLTGWHISPETNGTLLFENGQGDAGINIGIKDFSYFIIRDGHVTGENQVKFSVSAILKTMKKINLTQL
jgi:hypothetical protein